MIWPRSHSCRILTCLEPALLLNLVSFKFLINFSLLFPALSSGTFIDANTCLGFQGLQEPSLLIWFKFLKKGSKVSKHTEYALCENSDCVLAFVSTLGRGPGVSSPSRHLRLNGESLVLCINALAPVSSPLSSLCGMERTLRLLSVSLLRPAHVEKHSLNSGRLHGLVPTHTEKQTVLNTHREALDTNGPTRAPPQTKPHSDSYAPTHKHPHTQKHSDTRDAQSSRHAEEHHDAGVCAYTPHTVPPGAHTRRRATLAPDPRDSLGALASAHPGRPSLRGGGLPSSVLSPLLLLRLKMHKTLLGINPGSWLLPARPPAAAPPFIFARRR